VEQDFRQFTGDKDLNLNSHPQLVEWCAKRGVRASSFDEAHVASLLKRLDKKLMVEKDFTKAANYGEVRLLLHTKQALGGSSLKKLTTILDTTGDDRRLHDQYLHTGAGATFRTTGRGVQMQNLKRLNGEGDDMAELLIEENVWSNDRLASNLRQVFTATDPLGLLIVGDFSSVESRGLAWQAGEGWKLEAYAKGQDLYKVQAGLIFGKHHDDVSKSERQVGKVGELSCGYGAGGEAVKDFAEKMGVLLSEVEAAKLVKDWRAANPKTVDYWNRLDAALHRAIESRVVAIVSIPHGTVEIFPRPAPESLRKQVGDPHLVSLTVRLILRDGTEVLSRVIHGTSIKGRNIQYWKPSERKTGNLWSDEFVNQKTKRLQKYTVYGGKLAGLLTQSLCREVFFGSLRQIHEWVGRHKNVQLVGQFHDEIVLDWEPVPGEVGLSDTRTALAVAMTVTNLPQFPLAADIKADYRYIK
jgi:DNA polymerase